MNNTELVGALNSYEGNMSSARLDYLLRHMEAFNDALQGIDNTHGTMATGHPFYAISSDNTIVPIEEQLRYNEKLRTTTADFGSWPCLLCADSLPDLKTRCGTCSRTELKPRNIFKRAPDMDLWLIVEKNSADLEEEVQARLWGAGFYTSDANLSTSLIKLNRALRTLKNNTMPDNWLPIDAHIIERGDLIAKIKEMPKLVKRYTLNKSSMPYIPIQPRSLRKKWQFDDEPYNFVKDYLYSLTPSGWSDDDMAILNESRRHVRKIMPADYALDMLKQIDSTTSRQLNTAGIEEAFCRRYNSW